MDLVSTVLAMKRIRAPIRWNHPAIGPESDKPLRLLPRPKDNPAGSPWCRCPPRRQPQAESTTAMFFTLSLCGLFTFIYSLLSYSRDTAARPVKAPPDCLGLPGPTTFVDVITCLEDFTIDKGFYTDVSYSAAQPTPSQRSAWKTAISSLLAISENSACHQHLLPSELEGIYTIQPYTSSTGVTFCILLETGTNPDGSFSKGWGTLVVATATATTAARRRIHLSAPHPKADLNTAGQAAALFSATGAKSLLIPGRTRAAYRVRTDCVQGHGSSGDYWKTDPAHDNMQPFYDANIEIWRWQMNQGGCPSSSCAFIQLHGKGASTCPSDTVFLSTGLGNAPSSAAWYGDSTDRPIKRLRLHLATAFPEWAVTMPSESHCTLTATKNVVSRFLNGVPQVDVCGKNALVEDVQGYFVHVEQAIVSRGENAYEGWITALERTFVTV